MRPHGKDLGVARGSREIAERKGEIAEIAEK